MTFHRLKSSLRSSTARLLCLAGLLMPVAVAAQQPEGYSQLDVRPPSAAADLNVHLARLARNPRDVSALIGAGEAALALNDPRAATGFFARADEIQSGNGRIKAGLGRAMLQLQNPQEALRLFDQATRLGQPNRAFLSDRGLARDLTGDQAGAQQDYQAALRADPNDAEALRRYAVSLGISGQLDAAEKAIEPLLHKGDRAAWRNRAFVYAMNGRQTQARDITQKVMPRPLAEQIQPYMDRMPGLTGAQRAAAVHFGTFPSNIRLATAPPAAPVAPAPATAAPVPQPARSARQSRADRQPAGEGAATARPPRTAIALGSATAPPQPAAPDSDSAATRASVRANPRIGERIGDTPVQIAQKEADAARERDRQAKAAAATAATGQIAQMPSSAPAAAPAPQPQPRPAQGAVAGPAPSGTNAPVQGPPAPNTPAFSAPAQPAPIQPAPVPSSPPASAPVQGPPADSGVPAPAAQPQIVQPPATQPPPTPSPQATRSLADIIRELDVPESERQSTVAAVDLTKVAALQEQKRAAKIAAADKAKRAAAAKLKAEADAQAKAEAAEKARLAKNPARAWVQVATGQSTSALGFTLRALRKKHDSLAARDAWTAAWGRTNRLVVGPFTTFAKARAFEAELKKAGADVFAWQSDAGEEVTRLPGK